NPTGQEPDLVGLWNFDDPANPGREASPNHRDAKLIGGAKVVRQNRMRSQVPEVLASDEPLTSIVPVEQRATHLLRLDGATGSMIVEALQGFGAGDQAHTIEAWIRPHAAPLVRSWPLVLGTPGSTSGSHYWRLASNGRAQLGISASRQVTLEIPPG